MESWQEELKNAVSSVTELLELGYISVAEYEQLKPVEQKFRTLIPRYYLNLINKSDPSDAIRLMAIPQVQELVQKGMEDPIGDLVHLKAARLTHRYPNRALLHVNNICPMYCRFCFRKNLMNDADDDLYKGEFTEAFRYLKNHHEVEELILSGGDPWMYSDDKLGALLLRIKQELPHLKKIRFHTRMPVTLPSRVNEALISTLKHYANFFQMIIVTHFNHPRELTKEATAALKKMRAANFLILNQSVLLRKVNDDTKVLQQLFVGLGDLGIMPYYLHHCDIVAGADHFRLSLEEGLAIWQALRGKIAGYLIPEYVVEVPGGGGKVPVSLSSTVM